MVPIQLPFCLIRLAHPVRSRPNPLILSFPFLFALFTPPVPTPAIPTWSEPHDRGGSEAVLLPLGVRCDDRQQNGGRTDSRRSAAACRPSLLLPPTATDAALCSHHPRTTSRCRYVHVCRLAATIPAPPSSRRRVSRSSSSSGSGGSSSRSVPAVCADGPAGCAGFRSATRMQSADGHAGCVRLRCVCGRCCRAIVSGEDALPSAAPRDRSASDSLRLRFCRPPPPWPRLHFPSLRIAYMLPAAAVCVSAGAVSPCRLSMRWPPSARPAQPSASCPRTVR